MTSAASRVSAGFAAVFEAAIVGGTFAVLFLAHGTSTCVAALQRRCRKPQASSVAALAVCVLIAWSSVHTASDHVVNVGPTPATAAPPPPPLPRDAADGEGARAAAATGAASVASAAAAATQRVAVTIRSQHTGKYWQVLNDGPSGKLRLSASASPQQRGLERTVFLLEREGSADAGGWVLLRWLKTRQLLEAVPPGVPGREDDAWSVRLSEAASANELHKLIVEDDPAHTQSHIWSVALRGYLNQLEA